MKRLFYLFIVFISFLFIQDVDANSVSSITMDIYIDASGTAHVKESWNANLTSGTEGYKPYYNIGNSEFINFKVTDGENVYTNIGSWNTNASFGSKSYKNGINRIGDGVELCFGISNYGHHNYILEYDITNFVDGLNDADAIYWTLFPHDFSVAPDSVYIKMYADKPFSDDLDVWGYGNYGGYAYVYDGYIEMSTNGPLSSSEYMTILAKFPKGTFDTTNTKVNKNFSDYLSMAEEGAENYSDGSNGDIFSIIFMNIIILIFNPITMIIVIFFSVKNASRGLRMYNWRFNNGEDKLPNSVPLYRDIPFNKDIYKVYFLANLYKLAKNKNDLLGAVLLKWIKDGNIEITKVNSPILKREETAIRFKDEFFSDYDFESKLYNMMRSASKDGLLESHELDIWCQQNHSRLLKWFDTVVEYEMKLFTNNGQIEFIRGDAFSSDKWFVKTSLYDDAKVVKGLNDFLIQFSRIDDREAIEVVNWQEYLIIAQILGIADKVAKQFKKLYPEVITDYNYDNVMFVRNFSVRGISSAKYAKSAAETRSSSYSSGGGGRISRGGGGGSRGGGSRGGGGFR